MLERKSDLLKITSYPSDPVIKAAISKILMEYAGQCRSNLRKVIWRFVARRVDLDSWANYMLSHYVHKSSFTDMMKAQPLVGLPTSRGQDTGFWKKLNDELRKLYDEHGQQLESETWKRWADDIIAADKALYSNSLDGVEEPEDDSEQPVDDDAVAE
ncbi:hypothetical protein EXIGLDRAFT_778616 [Exidia glandulosa HHB12029]|uniref:Uncharacterized protein n=1 Tax=Exidia glandulosa HHB12029 TaxID=1314781 RepID=A0A165CGH8_EXIGL|nr:hypothetical protein EXIGLDRAFT_778616 [Exidia glandulosa HHB12029]